MKKIRIFTLIITLLVIIISIPVAALGAEVEAPSGDFTYSYTDIVNRLIDHIKNTAMPGTGVQVGLTAVKGKEPFYEKLGFDLGSSGMNMWINIEA